MSAFSDCTILVVDDTEANIDILVDVLDHEYSVNVAMDGGSALRSVEKNIPDLILLDIIMPGIDGYEVCRQLKYNEITRGIPVIFLAEMTQEHEEAKGLALGAVDYISKPFSPELVKARISTQLELKKHRNHLKDLVEEKTRELMTTQEVTIEGLATLAEYRDPETTGHIQRTKNYVRLLATHLKNHLRFKDYLNNDRTNLIFRSAPLHDIGKIGVLDSILLKPGSLVDNEIYEMKKHVIYGHDAIKATELKLGNTSFLSIAREIAISHHEKWDGSGYPYGLKGENIPVSGRLMAVADVYDALISKRMYKPAFSHERSVEIIMEGDGRTAPEHFDPDVLKAFVELADDFRQISKVYTDFSTE